MIDHYIHSLLMSDFLKILGDLWNKFVFGLQILSLCTKLIEYFSYNLSD